MGKSALLSNWLVHHEARRKEATVIPSGSPSRAMAHKEEFVFWYVAGCSRSSTSTIQLLRRLENELQARFELKREVSKDDQRLRWDLPDFLALAAHKSAPALILIVVDGLHRMRDEDGEEDLKWLPQTYPSNVRLIVSTTAYGSEALLLQKQEAAAASRDADPRSGSLSFGGGGGSLFLPAGDEGSRGSLWGGDTPPKQIASGDGEGLVAKDEGDSAARGGSSGGSNKTFHELRRRGWDLLHVEDMSAEACQQLLLSCVTTTTALEEENTPQLPKDRLVLFSSQCLAIVGAPMAKNPLFLRLLLQALGWSARQNLDLWLLLASWTQANSVNALYDCILDTWEQGLCVSAASQEDARRRVAHEQQEERTPVLVAGGDGDGHAGPPYRRCRGTAGPGLAIDVPDELPLAEIRWRKVHADADKAIEDARAAVERAAARAMNEAVEVVGTQRGGGGSRAGGAMPTFRNEALIQYFVQRQQPADTTSPRGAVGWNQAPSTVDDPRPADELPLHEQDEESGPPLPSYLTGGETFDGLGALLGNTLAALYVARHGLKVDELVHLLENVRERDDHRVCGLLWKHQDALLRLCHDLDPEQRGVLDRRQLEDLVRHHPATAAIKRRDLGRILAGAASCMTPADEVQYHEFLHHCGTRAMQPQPSSARRRGQRPSLEAGLVHHLLEVLTTLGVLLLRDDQVLVLMLESETLRQVVQRRYIHEECVWHQAIIQYFQSQPSSLLRRCEELPWHLHVCQEWKALKSFLVELDTFQTMYRGGLKGELFEYWRLLTEGPLWLPNGPRDEDSSSFSSAPVADSLLPGQGTGGNGGRLKLPLFDIVECYNHSIEQWKASAAATSSSSQSLADLLWLVGRFLAEFAEAVAFKNPFPRYLRKPLDLALMEMVGIHKKEDEPLANKLFLRPLPPPPPPRRRSDSDDEESDEGETEEPQESGNNAQEDDDAFAAWDDDDDDDGMEESEQARRRRQLQLEVLHSRAALVGMDSSYYFFKRWIWIQFPWIALANANLALRQFLEEGMGMASTPGASLATAKPATAAVDGDQDHDDAAEDKTLGAPASSPTAAVVVAHHKARPRHTVDQPRIWAVKKRDPTRTKAVQPESVEFRTMVRSSAMHLAPRAEHADRLVDSIYHDDPIMAQAADPPALSRDIRGDKEEDEEQDVIQTVFVSSTSGLPTTRKEKRLQDSGKRVGRLRAVLDEVTAEKVAIQSQLVAVQRMAAARDRQDGEILRGMETGEFLVQALHMRLRRLTKALTEAEALGWYYEGIIDQCLIKNPVKDTKRLETLDKQVALATSQCESLHHHWRLVQAEKERLVTEEMAKVRRQLGHVATERANVQRRLDLLREHAQQRAPQGTTASRMHSLRHTVLFLGKRVKGMQGPSPPQKGCSRSSSPVPPAHDASVQKQAAPKLQLTAYQSIFAAKRVERIRLGMAKLFEMSGVNAAAAAAAAEGSAAVTDDVDGASARVVRMFKKTQKSNKTYLREAQALEAKASSLRTQLQVQETKMVASMLDKKSAAPLPTTVTGVASPTTAPRYDGGAIRLEELRCAKYQLLSGDADKVLDQLNTGVNHLARLVARYSVSLPLASLRAASGEHEDQYDGADLYKTFSLYDERITSIQEIVVLEANEKADGAIKTLAVTAKTDDPHHRGGGMSGGEESYRDLLFSVAESEGAVAGRARGNTSESGTAAANLEADLLGIDLDMVMYMKSEAARSKKQHLPRKRTGGREQVSSSSSSLRSVTDRHKIRIHALASMEELYESKTAECRKRDDDSMERLEREEHQQILATDTDETNDFFRHALILDSPSHLRMRQVMKQEWDVEARQYPHLQEAHGLAIEQVLSLADTSMKKLLRWDKATTSGGAAATAAATATGTTSPRPLLRSKARPSVHLTREDVKAISQRKSLRADAKGRSSWVEQQQQQHKKKDSVE